MGSNPTAVIFAFCFQFGKVRNNCRLAAICYLFGSCLQRSCSKLCDARRFGQSLTLHAFQHCCNSANRQTGKLGNASGSKPTAAMYFNSWAGIEKLPVLGILLWQMKLHMHGSGRGPGVGQARECRIEFQTQLRGFVHRRATGPACACVANHLRLGVGLIWNHVCVDTACRYCCNTIAYWTCRHYLSAWTAESRNCSSSCLSACNSAAQKFCGWRSLRIRQILLHLLRHQQHV